MRSQAKFGMRGTLRQRGNTLIELLVVVAIIALLLVVSLPSMTVVIGNAKLRGSMGDLSNLMQTSRMLAVKQNAVSQVRFTVSQGRPVAYVDSPVAKETSLTPNITVNNTTMPRPQIMLPLGFTKINGAPSGGANSPTPLDSSIMWATSTTSFVPDSSHETYFNPLGLPCTYSAGAGTCPISTTGYVYYFSYAATLGGPQWAAVGVSPAGRIKVWYWTGSAWKN